MPKPVDLVLGQLALQQGLVSGDALRSCTDELKRSEQGTLAQLLVRHRHLSAADVARLLPEARRTRLSCPACHSVNRASELEEELGLECPDCGGPLTMARVSSASLAAVGSRPRLKRFGRFRIVNELGRGGMGVVYVAQHPELRGDVALKVIKAGAQASAQKLRRFEREVQVVTRLRHPAIVPVHDVGQIDGCPYYTMELIEGQDLRHVIQESRPAPRRAAEIARDLARGLAHAHTHGVVHRDVKPANVLIDGEGRPRLTDFGLARDLEADDGMRLTREGARVGTPAYMSPEQAAGERVGPSTDVYAVGALLFEMLTGRLPYPAKSPVELRRKIARDPVPRPSDVVSGLPADLDAVVMCALAKRPSGRYASASALANDLDRYLRGQPVEAGRGGTPPPPAGKDPRRLQLAAAVGIGALLLAAAYAWDTRERDPDPEPPASATPGPTVATETPPASPVATRAAPGTAEAALERARRAPSGEAFRQALQEALTIQEEALRAASRDARLLVARGRIQEALGRVAAAEADYRRAAELARGEAPGPEARVRLARSWVRRSQRLRPEAVRLVAGAPAGAPGLWRHLGAVLLDLWQAGDPAAAQVRLRSARALDDTHPAVPAVELEVEHALGRLEAALAAGERALRLEPNQPALWARLGALHLEAWDLDAAHTALARALELCPRLEPALRVEAALARLEGRREAAIETLAGCLSRGATDPELLLRLAELYAEAGRASRAEEMLARARALDPFDAAPELLAARLQLARDDVSGALASLRAGLRRLARAPARASLAQELRRLALASGLLLPLQEYCDELLAESPGDPDASALVAELHFARGEPALAGAVLDVILPQHPRHLPSWRARLLTGAAALPRGEREVHRRYLAEEVARDAPAWSLAAHSYLSEGQLELAERWARRALDDRPAAAGALVVLGEVALGRDAPERARILLRRALQPDERADARSALGRVERALRRPRAAEHHFRRALALDPFRGDAVDGLCAVLAVQGRHDEAVQAARRYLGLPRRDDGNEDWIEVTRRLAEALLALERGPAARALLEEALARAPHTGLRLALARVYLRAGERGLARELVQAVLAGEPDHPEARALRAELR